MIRTNKKPLWGRLVALTVFAGTVMACEAEVRTDPTVECRTVVVRRRRDVEECHTKCGDDGCHTRCREHERYARAKRCWLEE
jgi:hypothetical protein